MESQRTNIEKCRKLFRKKNSTHRTDKRTMQRFIFGRYLWTICNRVRLAKFAVMSNRNDNTTLNWNSIAIGIPNEEEDCNIFTKTMMNKSKTNSCTASQNTQTAPRRLVAFDFDYTIVGQNTDTVVRDILPPSKQPSAELIESEGWMEYMAAVFRHLHQEKVPPAKIRDTIRGIPEVPGFMRLIKRLHREHECELIIISDSNTVFIDEWLRSHGGLNNCFSAVFTNPAQFDDDTGLLTVKPYHNQTDCRLSAPNLCKGRVMEHFLIEQDLRHNRRYETLVYVGDGTNDICPVVRCLRRNDYACARSGYALEKSLLKNPGKLKAQAELVRWNNGFDLLEMLEDRFQTDTATVG